MERGCGRRALWMRDGRVHQMRRDAETRRRFRHTLFSVSDSEQSAEESSFWLMFC